MQKLNNVNGQTMGLIFVFHAHIPYVLGTEAEFWLYEAALHSYLPFLEVLSRLEEEGASVEFTLNLSPILLLQLDSDHFKKGFQRYINLRRELLSITLEDQEAQKILEYDLKKLDELVGVFQLRWHGDIISGFQYFHSLGFLNIITSAFTHPYLPLMQNFPNLCKLQISLGKQISEYYFGRIEGFWSPECGVFPELTSILDDNQLAYFFADPSALTPELLSNSIHIPFEYSDISYIVRDFNSTMKIWDAEEGFPSNSLYREFHTDFAQENLAAEKILAEYGILKSGFSIHSVSDKSTDKKLYNHQLAELEIRKDAKDFAIHLQQQSFKESILFNNPNPITAVFFDMELFGHWWKEGSEFLYYLVKEIDQISSMKLTSKTPRFKQHHVPKLSSWGKSNNAKSWLNEKTCSLWQQLISQNQHAEYLLSQTYLKPDTKDFLPLLLAQASDWMFLITYDSFISLSKKMILNNISQYSQFTKNSKISSEQKIILKFFEKIAKNKKIDYNVKS